MNPRTRFMFAHRGDRLDITAIQQTLRLSWAEGCTEEDSTHFTLLITASRLCVSDVKSALKSAGVRAVSYQNKPSIVTATHGGLYDFSIYKRICWAKIGASGAEYWSWSSKAEKVQSKIEKPPPTADKPPQATEPPKEPIRPISPTQFDERFEDSAEWLEFYDRTDAVY